MLLKVWSSLLCGLVLLGVVPAKKGVVLAYVDVGAAASRSFRRCQSCVGAAGVCGGGRGGAPLRA